MQGASASCPGVQDIDPDPDPPDSYSNHSSNLPLLFPRCSSIALELFDHFERVNSDENTDDIIMTEVASDLPFISFVPKHSSSSISNPRDDTARKRKRRVVVSLCPQISWLVRKFSQKATEVVILFRIHLRNLPSQTIPAWITTPRHSSTVAKTNLPI